MIILYTNVISELMRSELNTNFTNWLIENSGNDLFNTSVTYFEIVKGINCLPNGKRKEILRQSFEIMENRFEILQLDKESANYAAEFFSIRKLNGFKPSSEDMMIAGICAKHGATLATRNLRDFEGLPIGLVNPWRDL
jgi:toxin FitB